MLAAIRVFKSDLRNITGRRQNEVRMVNAILAAVRHSDDERVKRDRAQQVANALFHRNENSTDGLSISTVERFAQKDDRGHAEISLRSWRALRETLRAAGFRARDAKHAKSRRKS
jgi:hypothetical protein